MALPDVAAPGARQPSSRAPSVLVIGCGALARELLDIVAHNALPNIRVECLPAILHNRPEKIPKAVRARLESTRGYDRVFVAYGDCGTGGMLDRVLDEFGVERLPGAHCYQFYAGTETFDSMHDEEPATLYLTDYLARHFERLIWQGLGLDRYPDLLEDYFGNYRRLVYLAQRDDPELTEEARQAAHRLGLVFERHLVRYGDLQRELVRVSLSPTAPSVSSGDTSPNLASLLGEGAS